MNSLKCYIDAKMLQLEVKVLIYIFNNLHNDYWFILNLKIKYIVFKHFYVSENSEYKFCILFIFYPGAILIHCY